MVRLDDFDVFLSSIDHVYHAFLNLFSLSPRVVVKQLILLLIVKLRIGIFFVLDA